MTDRPFTRAAGLARCGLLAALLLAPGITPAASALSCPELQDRLERQLKAKGIAQPSLHIVPKNLVGKARVLGSCENDSQRIVWRDEAPANPASAPRR